MEKDDLRNTIVFAITAVIILFAYQMFFVGPQNAKHLAEVRAAHSAAPVVQTATSPMITGGILGQSAALAKSPRVQINTPMLSGSIALLGGRIDDLYLKRYRQKLDPNSPPVQLFRPQGSANAFFVAFPWVGPDGAAAKGLPDDVNTLWTAQPGAVLTQTTPLVLTYDNGQGLKFNRTIAIDANYMFTVSDVVANTGAAPVSLEATGGVVQVGPPADFDMTGKTPRATSTLVHEGGVGIVGGQLKIPSYTCVFGQLFCDDWKKDQSIQQTSPGGWLGITQKYWLAALVPDQHTAVHTNFHIISTGPDAYEADYTSPVQTIAPGATITQTTRLFAGPKIVPLLQSYQKTLGIPRFDDAVDWGVYWFFTRLLFSGLEFFNAYLANIGLSILALTVAIRLLLFPFANKSYESMSKMRKIQPQVEELKKKFGEDQTKLQAETMAIYQREKINPLMGCLPVLIQIPVLYSLYKVLTVTIEMRQAPFFGWIHDLSARDPTTIWNLFGLIPWRPALAPFIGSTLDGSLHIGLLPILYGFTMWLSMSMSPPAGDPTQQRMMQFLPLIFTFTLAQFTVGLLIYWTWSSILSILQQYVIMHRFKVDNPIDSLIGRFAKPKPSSG